MSFADIQPGALLQHPWPDYLLAAVAIVLLPAMSIIGGRQLARMPPGRSFVPRYAVIVLRGWLVAALVVALWRFEARPLSALGLDIPVSPYGLAGLAGAALFGLFYAIQYVRLRTLAGQKLEKLKTRIARVKIAPRSGREFALFVALSITAGVWEELLYRGFLIWFFASAIGLAGAVILSGLIFGAGHVYQGRAGVLVTTVIGLSLGAFYAVSASLWWLMALHAMIDIFSGAVAWRLRRKGALAAAA